MTTITKKALSGITNNAWKLKLMTAHLYDSTTEQVQAITLTDFNTTVFTEHFSGYLPVEITFHHNHTFDAVYWTAEGKVNAKGSWNIDPQGLLLSQSTGDKIYLLKAKLKGEELSARYEYLSSDQGIEQLIFERT